MGVPIYLDYNATTPVDAGVLDAMLPWFAECFGNAASAHPFGRQAAAAIEQAREQVAAGLGARAHEIVFTSGATEADNLALKGAFEAAPPGRNRVLVAATEHKAVLEAATWLAEQRGAEVTILPVTPDGTVDLDAYRQALDDRVALVAVMLANNETGVVTSVAELAELAHAHGALIHTDATQALGRVPVDLHALGVDLASFSAHKAYGPKGVGALFVTRRTPLAPLLHGGGHEHGLRSGTANVPGIVGFGAAAELAVVRQPTDAARQAELTERLVDALGARIPDLYVIGAAGPRLPNTACLRFPGADAEAVMAHAPDVAVSSGSACTSLTPAPSHVLLAMGLDADAASECLRMSVGRPTTVGEVDDAARILAEAVERVRALSHPKEFVHEA